MHGGHLARQTGSQREVVLHSGPTLRTKLYGTSGGSRTRPKARASLRLSWLFLLTSSDSCWRLWFQVGRSDRPVGTDTAQPPHSTPLQQDSVNISCYVFSGVTRKTHQSLTGQLHGENLLNHAWDQHVRGNETQNHCSDSCV